MMKTYRLKSGNSSIWIMNLQIKWNNLVINMEELWIKMLVGLILHRMTLLGSGPTLKFLGCVWLLIGCHFILRSVSVWKISCMDPWAGELPWALTFLTGSHRELPGAQWNLGGENICTLSLFRFLHLMCLFLVLDFTLYSLLKKKKKHWMCG